MGRRSLAEERRVQILEAAARCIAEHGVEGATQERIAAAAGMSRPHIRHYVGNRGDLLDAVWARIIAPYVDRVQQIRGLLGAGLTTRIIKQILPCLDKPRSIHFPDATPEMLALLHEERDKLTERIDVLIRNRDAMTKYLIEVERCKAPEEPERSDDRAREAQIA